MRNASRAQLFGSAGLGAMLLLSACGGGGGGVSTTPAPPVSSTPTPTPVPTPVPTPTPTPTPTVNYDTAEYRATVGSVSANALVMYQHGAIGTGIKVGVIDSGIDLQSAEFGDCSGGIGTGTCRISASSQSVAGNGTIDDEGGHGTAVAFTIAGRRNDAGTHGIAFDSTIVALRTDTPGSCATETDSDPESGCKFNDNNIAAGIDAARLAGVRVINMSLGGSAANSAVLNAVSRATAAGIIIVISAGNDGAKPEGANPDPFAALATNAAVSRGLVIIAGSVGQNDSRNPANDVISTFSNRAGTGANFYLAAVGERVRAPDENNVAFLWSGTSFAAPQIAGAIALLAQAFPNLTGAQIVQILYATARDAGAAGVDSTYGRGVLDLTRAFEPIGAMTVAGSQKGVVSDQMNASLSAPMGDAKQGALGAVALDGFQRAYMIDMARSIRHEGGTQRLPALMASQSQTIDTGVGGMAVAMTVMPGRGGVTIERLSIGTKDAERARALAASVVGRLGEKAEFAIGASESGNALTARLAGRADPAFLVARDPTNSSGFDVDVGGSVAVRQHFGPWGLTMAMETGDVLTRRDTDLAALRWRAEKFGYGRSTLALDRRFGWLNTGVSVTRLAEANSVLGARFSGALGNARATSWFVDLGARAEFGGGWSLGVSMRQGWTRALLSGGVQGSGMIRTNGFAADLNKYGLFGRGDVFGIRVAQPLRVASGGLDLNLPQAYDYATLGVTEWQMTRLNLTPVGREIDYEMRYTRPVWRGTLSGNAFLRSDPGNYAALPADYGAAVRYTFGF